MLNYRESIGRSKREKEERDRLRAEIEQEQAQQFAESQNISQDQYRHTSSYQIQRQSPTYEGENMYGHQE